jgi:hypothetical protein
MLLLQLLRQMLKKLELQQQPLLKSLKTKLTVKGPLLH